MVGLSTTPATIPAFKRAAKRDATALPVKSCTKITMSAPSAAAACSTAAVK